MDCFISIELGTNAVRVYAFDTNGAIVGFNRGAYTTFHPAADYSEQDPEQIFITMLFVLKNLVSEIKSTGKYQIVSLCFSASMHSLLAVDRNGVPLGNAITWADNRGKQETKRLRTKALARKLYEATGTPIHPMSPLLKILWLKSNQQEKFEKTSMFLSIKSYIIMQLTGRYVIDLSLASATGLLNIHHFGWEQEALDYAGITPTQLPDIVPISDSSCKLKRQYQVSLGIGPETKIIVGSSDGCFASLGGGIMEEGRATITIEDSAAMRIIGRKVLQDEGCRMFNYILDEHYYISGGPSNNGSVVFEWFSRQFANYTDSYSDEMVMRDLLLMAEQVDAGADGLLFLPYLLGERAPIWNPSARGVYFGANINHDRRHFIRATIEGILFEMYSIGKLLLQHRDISQITVNGSFVTAPLISRLLADIFNIPMSVNQHVSAVSTGAFLLSAKEFGIYRSLEEAAKSITLHAPVHPDPANHAIYAKYHQLFEKLTDKLSPEFELLDELTLLSDKH
ncbi:gluconokinase [Chitinophaga terrae (ex Kim and Jung 2007)]|uniref:gluconokinase n=1 Tax=Chitinophaga terrae (ex Kim and Jung 2007) TaxID=408074 RepID=UPI00277FB0B2|nr:gluconokinase [Chitinophaga terrae (ex Kim and Jung 2007)]MDQ0107359.1 gluconokinase [Chitinophaga terrae (ex Kim and Jung 2007)]